jgi:hypothetical protein
MDYQYCNTTFLNITFLPGFLNTVKDPSKQGKFPYKENLNCHITMDLDKFYNISLYGSRFYSTNTTMNLNFRIYNEPAWDKWDISDNETLSGLQAVLGPNGEDNVEK